MERQVPIASGGLAIVAHWPGWWPVLLAVSSVHYMGNRRSSTRHTPTLEPRLEALPFAARIYARAAGVCRDDMDVTGAIR